MSASPDGPAAGAAAGSGGPTSASRELAARWAQAVEGISYVPRSRGAVREFLHTQLLQLFTAAHEGDEATARSMATQVGQALVQAHFTSARVLSTTLAVLLEGSASSSGSGMERGPEHLHTRRWQAVLAALAEGFSGALRERALLEQEGLLRAAGEAREQAQAALDESEERFRAVFDGARIGIGVGDLDGRILEVNPALAQMLGYPAANFRERAVHDFMHPADVEQVWQFYSELVRGERDHFRLEKQFVRSTGESVWTDLTVSLLRDPEGVPRYQLALIHDMSAVHELRARLEFEAHHDSLTGLANRKMFLDRLDEAFHPGRSTRAGLCFLDLDGFKAVNDTLGHGFGDELLRCLATRLQAAVRDDGHLVARLGGDEFVVLVRTSSGSAQLIALAENLLATVAEPVQLSAGQVAVTASVGIVERPVAGTDPAALLRAADMSLYWAKSDGKSRWALYEPGRGARDVARYALSSQLPAALVQDDLRVHYQPLRLLRDGSLHGVEALVRWQHPTLGLLAPMSFVSLAEQSGLIVPLGRMVLRTACLQAFDWFGGRSDGPFVSVNLASQQLRDPTLVSDVRQALLDTGLHPHQLQLEITESAVVGTDRATLAALHALSEMGIRLAIDDFGTGYSNLSYLRRLPVSELKLDGSFLLGLQAEDVADPVDVELVASMVSLAHVLGLTVTAEGVETPAQLAHLVAVGCDAGQGTLLGAAEEGGDDPPR